MLRRLTLAAACVGVPFGGYKLFAPFDKPVCREEDAYRQSPPTLARNPNPHILTKQPKTIGIIGAGLGGLAAAKELKQQGYSVEILEAKDTVGGIWVDPYDGATIQFPHPHYWFPDFPFLEDTPMIPSLAQMQEHAKRYADTFDLISLCRFGKKVKTVRQRPDDQTWECLVENERRPRQYDFLVVATGLFTNPYRPKFPGEEQFTGSVIHSTECTDMPSKVGGKRVVIIGGGKSAQDVAIQAVDSGASSTTILCRRKLWWLMPFSVYGIPFDRLLFSRLGYYFHIPFYADQKTIQFQSRFPSLVRRFWRSCENRLRQKFINQIQPTGSFQLDLYQVGSGVNPTYQEKIQSGALRITVGEVSSFGERSVQLKGHNQQSIDADVVILATGYEMNLFDFPTTDEGIWLYHNTFHPDYKNLAFIGLVKTNGIPVYQAMQAMWMTEVLRGRVYIPPEQKMRDDIQKQKQHARQYLSERFRAHSVFYLSQFDQWLDEMGTSKYRQKNWYEELTKGYLPSDYKEVITHRK